MLLLLLLLVMFEQIGREEAIGSSGHVQVVWQRWHLHAAIGCSHLWLLLLLLLVCMIVVVIVGRVEWKWR